MESITTSLGEENERASMIEEKSDQFLHSDSNKEKYRQSLPHVPRSLEHG
jgi:hypothetical protein